MSDLKKSSKIRRKHVRNNLPCRVPGVRSNDDGKTLGADVFLLIGSIYVHSGVGGGTNSGLFDIEAVFILSKGVQSVNCD
jgi:hypothetical protein